MIPTLLGDVDGKDGSIFSIACDRDRAAKLFCHLLCDCKS